MKKAQINSRIVIQMNDNTKDTIGKKLKIFRHSEGLSQDKLAIKLGITRRTLSLIETGNTKASTSFIRKMKLAFPFSDLSWLTGQEVAESQAQYGDTIESRLARIEKKLEELSKLDEILRKLN